MLDDRERIKKIGRSTIKLLAVQRRSQHKSSSRDTDSAEFWEGSGTVVTAVKLAAAIASGERINLGATRKY